MSDLVDGIGTMAEGALVGAAIEGGRPDDTGHTHETECLNCGTHLVGSHCHACGQHAHVHRTIGALFHDILHGVLHFEGRTWATLPMLAWKPGQLTRRYVDGQRVAFVSPMALFLFSIFVMFAVLQIMGISPPVRTGETSTAEHIAASEERLVEKRKDLLADLAADDMDPAESAEKRQALATTEENLAGLRALPAFMREKDAGTEQMHSGWKRLDKGIGKWRDNPGLMLYKLQTTAYKFSWLLIPLSVPFVALLFLWRRRFGLYDHAVFVTYSLAFMTMLGIVATIIGALGVASETLLLGCTAIACVHIYRHLQGTYELSAGSTLWRTVVLLCLIQIVLGLFATALVFLGLVG
ncbi:DUF3667 domain-containing protein [Novosphingobium sp. YJ-S2-02]|uniref:DUF3667 domain-containing protein n=1 Tax=Novosphingobium aureum TaxID=2792964 RepID=A0A931HD70_9SPHN|nr:DUF3667 domain-containing protein [Novosphingobium aureum]MBH0113900.1 DUF3667 domain-containing protein [Novosphingobium aureum]